MALIEIMNLEKSFHNRKTGDVQILRGIDFNLDASQTICVVGESGCGKTTLGKILAGLQTYTGGSFLYNGKEVSTLEKEAWKAFRTDVQMIHQNPYESLNPTQMVFDMIAAPLKRHKKASDFAALYEQVVTLLEMVGLTPVEDFIDKYPANLSGGQRQRVSIARVLSMDPKFIVVDEATSMIDTSMRISLLQTLKEIQQKMGVAYLYITHDLALGRYFAWGQRLAVMYLGQVVEMGPAEEVLSDPHHPYTKAIMAAGKVVDEDGYELKGVEIPSFRHIPQGCSLSPRCPEAIAGLCEKVTPTLRSVSDSWQVSCHLYQEQT
ncbi:ABC transporter ATP-binding protein [uncultured Sphaerochaeta sp.]|uniref:ABC transporter ATP-binding protein n=1 Tax=uncultured Sphaerochaeta sp. TaxID=886478 RepID=UPI002A0A4901|nr:ABC transporter ATP-binding protein [uncultured Sphaerochaeta sp.]